MKPTEQDIQAELIEGWLITDQSASASIEDGGWFDIGKGYCRIAFYRNFTDIEFNYKDECNEANYTDFLTGNYDLSAISQHYEPEEWQRIISMCERIVRIITGEQTLEEKVREILEPLGTNIDIVSCSHSCVEIKGTTTRFKVFQDRIETTFRGDDETETIAEYQENKLHVCEWRKALPSIAALLTPSDQPEQTLEDAVKGWLENVDNDGFEIKPDHVLVHFRGRTDRIECDHISDGNHHLNWHVSTLDHSRYSASYVKAIRNIAAELSKRYAKPSYSDLEQRVEELETELIQQKRETDLFREQSDKFDRENIEYFNRIRELERENASLLEKFGPIDQAEQQVAEVETRFQKLAAKCERIAEVLIELNEAIL